MNRARTDLNLFCTGLHGSDSMRRIALNSRDALLDLVGSLTRLFRQLSDLLGDDGEAAACLTGTRRFNGSIE